MHTAKASIIKSVRESFNNFVLLLPSDEWSGQVFCMQDLTDWSSKDRETSQLFFLVS